ncbi:hypothetical protein AB0L13_38775 [Saccharopolyspora shandongensis]|uniref:hypothetical protein n=1 Tax=Saccharopolyspora shandongensis TaxID=418495 RepID=UPI003419EEB6
MASVIARTSAVSSIRPVLVAAIAWAVTSPMAVAISETGCRLSCAGRSLRVLHGVRVDACGVVAGDDLVQGGLALAQALLDRLREQAFGDLDFDSSPTSAISPSRLCRGGKTSGGWLSSLQHVVI